MKRLTKTVILLITVAIPGLCGAQAKKLTMSGFVTDKVSSHPVVGARVTMIGNKAKADTTTDSEGAFVLSLAQGVAEGDTVRIQVEKAGYKPYEKLLAVSPEIPLRVSLETDRSKPVPPPKVKQWSVSPMIPLVKSGISPGIPDENFAKGQPLDPLFDTYATMAEMDRFSTPLDPQTLEPRPVSDDEARSLTADVLRYCLVLWIAKIQNPQPSTSYIQGVGAVTNMETAVPVPQAEPYPKGKLEGLLRATRFGVDKFQYWFWEKDDKFKFDVPVGTDVEVSANGVTFSRKGVYKLQFTVEYSGENVGVAGLPVGFKLRQPVQKPDDLVGLMFTVKGIFEWYGEYANADPYLDWVNGLFAGLDKRLKQRSPFELDPLGVLRVPRTYLVFEDRDPFPFDPPRDFMVGDRLSFNVFTRNKGPNELQGVIDALWLYLETDYEYSTQARLLADFQRRIRDSSSAHPAIPRSLEPGDGHFVSAFAWDETNNPNYLQQPDLDALHAGTKICFVVVQVSYNDNGVTHHLRRCEWLQPPASHPGIWHFCQDFASD